MAVRSFAFDFGKTSVEITPSMQEQIRSLIDLRQDLVSNGVLELTTNHFATTEFSKKASASQAPPIAAAIVLSRSTNGRVESKDTAGRTLKEIQKNVIRYEWRYTALTLI